MSDSDFDDDDFGDFEEGEVLNEAISDISLKELSIAELIDEILPQRTKVEKDDDATQITEFQFDSRSEKLFENLVNTEEYPLQQMIWKRSMILKQLFLNLDIPITETDQFSRRKSHQKMDLDYDLNVNEEIHFDIPNFADLKLTEDQFKQILSKTDEQLSQLDAIKKENYSEMTEEDASKEVLKLAALKQSFMETMSAWNKQYEDVKADNDLFTSYIENLVGNTQKFRRRQIQSKNKK